MVATADLSLQTITAGIRESHAACLVALSSALDHARTAGELLIRAKEALPHGSFQAYVEDECGISASTGRVYMSVCRRWDEIEQAKRDCDHVLTLSEARRFLAAPKSKPAGDDEPWKTDPELMRLIAEIIEQSEAIAARWREVGGIIIEARDLFQQHGMEDRIFEWCELELHIERAEADFLISAANPDLTTRDLWAAHEAMIDRQLAEAFEPDCDDA